MPKSPSIVFIARHGARLDAADKDWHLTAPEPYNPPLSYGGWMQARALGVRISSLLRNRHFTGQEPRGPHQHRPTSDGQAKPTPASSDLCHRYNVIVHTSPFLRCLQTAIGVSAGINQQSTTTGTPGVTSPFPTIPEAPTLDTRCLVRVDAFLGEWLSPDYYDQITPPPGSDRMVAFAKGELIRRAEVIPAADGSTRALSGHFPGGWGSRSQPTSPAEDEERRLQQVPEQTQRQRSSTYATLPTPVTTKHAKTALGRLNTDLAPTVDASYVPPTPSYAVSASDPIPTGYVAHARDACTKIDYQWDSMRTPYWGTGGEYGEEWSTMHERVHDGFQHMINWYREQNTAPLTQSRGADGDEVEPEPETVLILITHGADCNALISSLNGHSVLVDINTASLTMAVRRDRVNNPSADMDPMPPSSEPENQSVSREYSLQFVASTDHLRPGINPSQLTSLASPSAPAVSPSVSSYRNRLGARPSLQASYTNRPSPGSSSSLRGWTLAKRPSTASRGAGGLWGSVEKTAETEDPFPDFGDRPASHDSAIPDQAGDRGWVKQLPQRTQSQRGLWGSSQDDREGTKRRWTVTEQKTRHLIPRASRHQRGVCQPPHCLFPFACTLLFSLPFWLLFLSPLLTLSCFFMSALEVDGLSVTYSSDRTGSPDLRLIHYNDVYHVESGSAEPIGGVARFQSLVNYYRAHSQFAGQPDVLTFFSGDAFNPSIESTITKGRHMVPFLNTVGTDVACVGVSMRAYPACRHTANPVQNHDLDFGVVQFRHLASQCHFPWLLANVLDPALGEDTPIADCGKTRMLTSTNGLKIGVLGLGEREWLDTINALPPDLIYQSASQTAQKLAKQLRDDGADLVVAVTHQREPNDYKLANNLSPGLVDIILGGHDHFYAHAVVNGVHIIRSGTDFKQLSYIEAFRKPGDRPGWDFNITRRDVVRSIPEDPDTVAMVARLGASLKAKLDKPIGFTVSPLDGRFSTVRQRESNLGNFVCDLMRYYYAADCAMMAGGTIRGDQIYPPGILKLKDLLNCFPFEDPVVLIRVRGHALLAALENGVSQLPALEGRFSQVSNISYGFKLEAPSGSRITFARVGGEPIDLERDYVVATRGYMARGKDGFTSLLIEAEGGEVEELVSEENGVLISTILRQYFLSLKVLGKWNRWSASLRRHWGTVHRNLHNEGWLKPPSACTSPKGEKKTPGKRLERPTLQRTSRAAYYYGRFPEEVEQRNQDPTADETNGNAMDSDSDEDPDILTSSRPTTNYVTQPAQSSAEEEHRLQVARRVVRKWMRHAGLQSDNLNTMDGEGEFTPAWTSGISPRLEGRIVQE
ncbi:unnamed protein product [Penicillium olsonii]|nr:unnamed protein product [Penicillium olsonii]